ncbi:MAG: 30S ribosomal protein S16 [Mycoplasmataceae bacterium]|jgi:small subunit ribosomal protein S16|nr:30S ribosomal protein S16 [Mycoplasmataceae bacterium]
MVKIRLTRLGKHKAPFYRIVATDSRVKRDGKYIALLGTFEPNKGIIKIKHDIAVDYLIKGAQPTETILSMFKSQGIWAEYLKTKATKKNKPNTKRKLSAKKVANKKANKKQIKKEEVK